MLNTIAELPAYRELAEKHLNAEERQAIIDYLAEHPKAGDVMPGAGGLRKLRRGKGGRGKSGGVRIVYYFHGQLPRPKGRGLCKQALKLTRPVAEQEAT